MGNVDHKPSQNKRVLKYMSERKGITQLEAWKYCGVMRLASRISDLRRLGYYIATDWVEVKNQFGETCRVKRYKLEEG